ncbi:MAG TPA: mannose-1-phosphate guanylyltransferase [Planctomycetaceae bacterium]|nr:mannose-1-phosphate guanylyltransferase [Planctomycetaceae bacterium]
MLHAVIMAGGSGTRLWPESRRSHPKQFLAFEGTRTMIAATIDRVGELIPGERVVVVTGGSMKDLVIRSAPGLAVENILYEPAARNTAPCIGWAAVELLRKDPEATMVVLPADHVVKPDTVFCDTLRFAVDLIEEDPNRLVTLGIKPTFPATSYGYVQRDAALTSPAARRWASLTKAYSVVRFHEKPSGEKATEFLASGQFGWNGGIFVWKAGTILELIRRFEPAIGAELDAIAADGSPQSVQEHFPAMKNISIDYAVLERAESIVMIDTTFEWDDVGTWCSLERLYAGEKDEAGNIGIGVEILAVDSHGNVVRDGTPGHLYALLGVDDLIVVRTADATLIARKDHEEAVREIIEKLDGKYL